MIGHDRSMICRKDSGLLLDQAEISFYSSMRSEVIDRKWQRQEKEREREKKKSREEKKKSNHTLFADNSIFRPRRGSKEEWDKPVEKTKQNNRRTIMISAKWKTTKLHDRKKETVLVLPRKTLL